MSGFESILQGYMAEEGSRRIPGVVLLAANRNGEIIADYAAGTDSVGRDPPRAYTKDTISSIHSMTKLVTAIAALQCVEHGLLTLDEDISKYCPEWKEPQVLEGFDGDKPILRKARGYITMRMLLSHSSGMIYERSSKDMAKWFEINKIDDMNARSVVLPLIFDPGESWAYGASSDWAGFVIEKATGMRLNDWMKENIFRPLGLPDATFRLNEVIASGKPFSDLAVKKDDDFIHLDGTIPRRNPNLDHGGGGIFCSASEYLQILLSILRNDGKLLKPESVELLFKPQLKNPAKLQSMMDAVARVSQGVRVPTGSKFDFSLGGLLNLDDFPGKRAKNSIHWSGMANLIWWLDRESGVCACIFEQVLPFGHPPSAALAADFEKYVYELIRQP